MKIRLHEATIINGRRCARGEIVELPDGVRGPHRAVQRSPDTIDYGTDPPIDANRKLGVIVDVPLYDVLDPPDELTIARQKREKAKTA